MFPYLRSLLFPRLVMRVRRKRWQWFKSPALLINVFQLYGSSVVVVHLVFLYASTLTLILTLFIPAAGYCFPT